MAARFKSVDGCIEKRMIMEQSYVGYMDECREALKQLEVSGQQGQIIMQEEGMERWIDQTKRVNDNNHIIYFAGNGASAMMAGHMSADSTKNGGMKSMFLSETSLITAVSNDISYDEVFAFPLNRFADKADMLIAISSSGNSGNIIRAIETAREKGLAIVTLTGLREDNTVRQLGDINFYVPGKTYGIVEVCHQALLHCWLDKYLDKYKGGRI